MDTNEEKKTHKIVRRDGEDGSEQNTKFLLAAMQCEFYVNFHQLNPHFVISHN